MYMNDGNKTKINLRNKSVFITGVAGFIGSNLAKRLLSTVEGVKVVGLDNMNHYYDVRLKEARLNELEQFDNFSFVKGNLADKAVIESIFEQYKPEIVVNLGAQAGVRYSITNPDAYVEANLIGFYNILEACRHSYDEGHTPVEHLVYAGHIIMDYSVHDAIEAGFNHVVFIIRKDIEKEFKEVIGDRIASICSSHNVTVDYAFQDINAVPGELPEGRTKPWGTGQAVLAAKKVINTPFIVINADDYYGKEGFKAVHEYLVNGGKSCMAGFVLKNTLSDNGGVTRGICKIDAENNLTEVVETKNIVKTADGAEADGKVIDVDSLVSMNMWGLTPAFLEVLEEGFKEFFEKEVPGNPLKAEYLIPIFIGELLGQGKMSVKVLKTNDTWYGMTYHEDVAAVKDSFKKMLENGVYKADLFSNL